MQPLPSKQAIKCSLLRETMTFSHCCTTCPYATRAGKPCADLARFVADSPDVVSTVLDLQRANISKQFTASFPGATPARAASAPRPSSPLPALPRPRAAREAALLAHSEAPEPADEAATTSPNEDNDMANRAGVRRYQQRQRDPQRPSEAAAKTTKPEDDLDPQDAPARAPRVALRPRQPLAETEVAAEDLSDHPAAPEAPPAPAEPAPAAAEPAPVAAKASSPPRPRAVVRGSPTANPAKTPPLLLFVETTPGSGLFRIETDMAAFIVRDPTLKGYAATAAREF